MNRYGNSVFFFLTILILVSSWSGAAEDRGANSVSGSLVDSIFSEKVESAPGWMAPWTGPAAMDIPKPNRQSPVHYPWFSPKARLSDYPMAGTVNPLGTGTRGDSMMPWSSESAKPDMQNQEESETSLTRGVKRGSGEENPFWSHLPLSEEAMEEGAEWSESMMDDSKKTPTDSADLNEDSTYLDLDLSPPLIDPTALLNGNPVLGNGSPFFEPFQLNQSVVDQENGALTGSGLFRVEANVFLFGQKTTTEKSRADSEGSVSLTEDQNRISLPGENLGKDETVDLSVGRGMTAPSQFGQSLFETPGSSRNTNSSLFRTQNTTPRNTESGSANWFVPSSAGGAARTIKPEDRAWFRP